MSKLIEMPDAVQEWLSAKPVAADHEDGRMGPWAEWDAHRGKLVLGVWLETECPTCHEGNRPNMSLVVPKGFGGNNWQHGCGSWWYPAVRAVGTADLDGEALVAALDVALAELKAEQGEEAARIKARLIEELRAFLELPEDEREPTGSDASPGIYHEAGVFTEGRWIAWDWDPRSQGGTDIIEVDEDDLQADL